MKIAFIVDEFPVLSGTFILNQITGLLDMGHDVRIFAYSDPHEAAVHSDVEKYDLRGRTHYVGRSPRSKLVCMLKALYLTVVNSPKAPRILSRFAGMFIARKKGLSLGRLKLLLGFLDNDFDIIQCHYGPVGIEGVFLKDAGVRAKVCTAFHGFDLSRHIKGDRRVYEELFRKGDVFMPVSEYWKRELVGLGCPEDKIIVHRMGVDVERFEYVEHRMDPNGPLRVLTVGRLVEKKGHRYAIEAIAGLVKGGRNIEYTIAGEGPLRGDLERIAGELGVQGRVRFLGAANQAQVRQLYRDSDVFVLASVTAADGDMEGVPVVLMEAMASGLAVVSTEHSGIAELVANNETGYLVRSCDANAIAAKLGHMPGDPGILVEMGRKGRRCVEQQYNIRTLNIRLAEVFIELSGQS